MTSSCPTTIMIYYLVFRVVIVKWLVCQILDEVSVAVMCKLVLKWKFQKIDKKKMNAFRWAASMIGHTLAIIDWFMCNT